MLRVNPVLRRMLGSKKSMGNAVGNPFSHGAVDAFIASNYAYFRSGHFHEHYSEWRMRRIRKILQIYEVEFFNGKTILEIGGGHGDIGAFFAELGADVLSLEARDENRTFANLKYRHLTNFKSLKRDVEDDFADLGRFDLIINFGLLEVVSNIDNVMSCCAKLSDDIILETMVCDSTDPTKTLFVDMDPRGIDNPLQGKSARPSPTYIENYFKNQNFSATRYFDSDLNSSGGHRYDWEHKNDDSVKVGLRRFWRFTRECEIAGSSLGKG
ncbi:MAG: methyltransferase domain-containing protein [SAR202 cluster bacterium]|nr:methyltransferase domain-containing protein [SAR202 cluster bacterium]